MLVWLRWAVCVSYCFVCVVGLFLSVYVLLVCVCCFAFVGLFCVLLLVGRASLDGLWFFVFVW